jgi:hypothetical protein
MKRVLFLALLIVSIVEFMMERNRLYLQVVTAVGLLALIYSLFHERVQIRSARTVDRSAPRKGAGEIVAK